MRNFRDQSEKFEEPTAIMSQRSHGDFWIAFNLFANYLHSVDDRKYQREGINKCFCLDGQLDR